MWSIYALKDVRTTEVRYVGCTFNVSRRYRAHLRTPDSDNSYRARWVRSVLASGAKVIMEILETGTGDPCAAEREWIERLRTSGARLVNTTEGGRGVIGYVWTDEARKNIGIASRGKKHSPQWVANAAAAHRALHRKVTPENAAKVSAAQRGKQLSPEQRRRISERLRGHPVTERARRALDTNRGIPLSAETRAKISATIAGRKHSAKEIDAMKAAWALRKQDRCSFPEMARDQRGEKSSAAKLTDAEIAEIRRVHSSMRGSGYRSLAKRFRVDPGTIRNIVKRKTWGHIL